LKTYCRGTNWELDIAIFWDKWDKNNSFFKNEPEELLKLNDNGKKTNRNKAKNEAEK